MESRFSLREMPPGVNRNEIGRGTLDGHRRELLRNARQPGPASDAAVRRDGFDEAPHPEEREQISVEGKRGFEVAEGQAEEGVLVWLHGSFLIRGWRAGRARRMAVLPRIPVAR
jgi:hypothetical protein